MKKILGILFLILLLSGNSYAKKFVKLPKDVGSGSKFYKSLTGKGYKKHGFQLVFLPTSSQNFSKISKKSSKITEKIAKM